MLRTNGIEFTKETLRGIDTTSFLCYLSQKSFIIDSYDVVKRTREKRNVILTFDARPTKF